MKQALSAVPGNTSVQVHWSSSPNKAVSSSVPVIKNDILSLGCNLKLLYHEKTLMYICGRKPGEYENQNIF